VTFSTSEAAELVGVSPRQLEWWDSKNIIKPLYREAHNKREYDLMGVTLSMIAGRLRANHINLTRIQKLCRALRKEPRFITALDSHRTGFLESFYLIVSTKQAKIANTSDGALAIMRGFECSFVLIAVHDFLMKIHRERVN
jgi:DNA-binding transcriptional MerR regulator